VQYSTVQYSAVQCSAVQCSAVQCSAVHTDTFIFRYMFEGLGHMMSSLIISAAPNIKKINSNGVKKM
jgi:hypothetical protein